MIIQPNSKLLMIGDSVTDCGRHRPIGELQLQPNALGNGYVSLVDDLLKTGHPGHNIRVINMGISGDTIRELKHRWATDVLDIQPDWLSICIGINDVWRFFEAPPINKAHVPLDEYAYTLEELVVRTRPLLKGLILMTPYYIQADKTDPMRAMMDKYGAVVHQIAHKYQTIFVDTQAAYDAALSQAHASTLAPDRIHPTPTGHMILARAFLHALDSKRQQ